MGRNNEEFKLFIGGLNPVTDTGSLNAHFSEYGTLTDCIVMTDQNGVGRGFGFVTYESAEGYNHILDAGGRVIVDGKEVEAKPATGKNQEKNNAPQRAPSGKVRDVSGKIFVGGTSHLSTEALAAHFSQFGEVADAIAMTDQRGTPRGFGFITFNEQHEANAAVDSENVIEGITVDVKHADGTSREAGGGGHQQQGARPAGRNQQANYQTAGRGGGYDQGKGGSGSKGGQINDAYKIFVGGLPNSVNSDRLHDLFQMYGPVVDCVAFQQRGFGYVTFGNSGAMNRALQAGTVQIDGKWVEIKARETKGGETKGGGKSGGNHNNGYQPPQQQMHQRNNFSTGKGSGKGSSGGGRGNEAGKIFVGGLNHATNDASFRAYFEQFGELSDSIVMKKPQGESRGFGFVTYADPSVSRRVINQENIIDDQQVDAKMAEREGGKGQDAGPQGRAPHGGYQKSSGGAQLPTETKKIFLGGLPQEMTTDRLKEYLSEYGEITDCIAMDGRGFGYVTFADEISAQTALSTSHIEIEGKSVEVKACTIPRHKGQGGRARPY